MDKVNKGFELFKQQKYREALDYFMEFCNYITSVLGNDDRVLKKIMTEKQVENINVRLSIVTIYTIFCHVGLEDYKLAKSMLQLAGNPLADATDAELKQELTTLVEAKAPII